MPTEKEILWGDIRIIIGSDFISPSAKYKTVHEKVERLAVGSKLLIVLDGWILKFIRGVYRYLWPNIVTRKFVDGFWVKSGKLESLLELIQCPWVWCEIGEVSWLIGAIQPTDGGSLQEKIFVRLVVHSNIGRLF